MRILKIRFKNLNSLAGEWEIDLTDPAYRTHGLFAITGPTGAGKSTLLDAVCLALYGRTPRLDRVNKSGNEIMSRRTGDCFAEVTFETQAGVFRAFWSHARARRNPEGELQQPKHEIADAKTGALLETKIRDVAGKIVEVTGMDFERFTRSMLLAQGGFAVFLQAPAEERASILEQITGTEIYSRISIQVHQRNAEEKRRLELMQAELNGLHPLTDAEVTLLEASLEEKNNLDDQMKMRLARLAEEMAWHDGIRQMEAEQQLLASRQEQLDRQKQAFDPQRVRLESAQQALLAVSDASTLDTLRSEQIQAVQLLAVMEAQGPELEKTRMQAEVFHQETVVALEAKTAEYEVLSPKLQQIRQKDVEIHEKKGPLAETEQTLQVVRNAQKVCVADTGKNAEELRQTAVQQQELEQAILQTASDEALVDGLTGLQARYDQMRTQQRQLEAKHTELAAAKGEQEKRNTALEALTYRQQGIHEELKQQRELYEQANMELVTLLAGTELSEFRTRRQHLEAKRQQGKDLLAGAHAAVVAAKRLESLAGEQQEQADTYRTVEAQIVVETTGLEAREREVALLEERLFLLSRITDLTQERERLEEGKPCPLCGATTHPYGEGHVPEAGEAEQELTEARRRRKEQSDSIQALQMTKASLAKEGEHLEQERKTLLSAFEAEVPAVSDCQKREKEVATFLSNVTKEVETLDTLLTQAEASEKSIGKLRNALDKARENVVKADTDMQAALGRTQKIQSERERLESEVAVFRDALDLAVKALCGELSGFAEGEAVEESKRLQWLEAVFPELTARQKQWKERQILRQQLEQRHTLLTQQGDQLTGEMKRLEGERIRLEQQLQNQLQILRQLEEIRHQLLGKQDADVVEQGIRQALKQMQDGEKAARAQRTDACSAWERLQTKIQERKTGISTREERLKEREEAFVIRVQTLGFAEEASWRSALLPEEARRALQEQAQMLEKNQHAIADRARAVMQLLTQEREKVMTDSSREELQAQQTECTEQHAALQQDIGAVRLCMKENRALRAQMAEKWKCAEAQQTECMRWNILHDLIGSADGKKYRNFAQGLTFEMMIHHANGQLARLSDRYLLTRDAGQPLELLVIDNYQAGETRSTKNLSGGESFLVSLSLALGLSHMASRKVRVDSLFLDEGFGTLDEETLSSALDTLASLQQDGKLIGVISHVGALKERIPTQIQVTPQANGRSVLAGPGCHRSSQSEA